MTDLHYPTIRLAQASDASELKNLNAVFNDSDDTTLGELETSLRENNQEIIVVLKAEQGLLAFAVFK